MRTKKTGLSEGSYIESKVDHSGRSQQNSSAGPMPASFTQVTTTVTRYDLPAGPGGNVAGGNVDMSGRGSNPSYTPGGASTVTQTTHLVAGNYFQGQGGSVPTGGYVDHQGRSAPSSNYPPNYPQGKHRPKDL